MHAFWEENKFVKIEIGEAKKNKNKNRVIS